MSDLHFLTIFWQIFRWIIFGWIFRPIFWQKFFWPLIFQPLQDLGSKIPNLQLSDASNEDVLPEKTVKATLFCHTLGHNWLPKTGLPIAHPARLPVIPLYNSLKQYVNLYNSLKQYVNSKLESVKGSHFKKKLL